jgi:hypothetical protein
MYLLETVPSKSAGQVGACFPDTHIMIRETVILYRSGVLIQIPRPERFAVHKLIVADRRRGGPDHAEARKDRAQAAHLWADLGGRGEAISRAHAGYRAGYRSRRPEEWHGDFEGRGSSRQPPKPPRGSCVWSTGSVMPASVTVRTDG